MRHLVGGWLAISLVRAVFYEKKKRLQPRKFEAFASKFEVFAQKLSKNIFKNGSKGVRSRKRHPVYPDLPTSFPALNNSRADWHCRRPHMGVRCQPRRERLSRPALPRGAARRRRKRQSQSACRACPLIFWHVVLYAL